jgi:hypothetical protein
MTILDVTGNSNSALDAGTGNRPPVAQRWPTLRVASTGETQVNRAASGDMAQDQAYKGYTITRSADTNAMVICDINDARFVNLSRISRYKDILSRIVGDIVLPTRKTVRSIDVTKTGSWANTQVDVYGMYATAVGAKVSAVVPGTTVYVGILVDNQVASQGVTADVYIDGVNKGTISSDNIGVNNVNGGNTYNNLRYGPALFRYPGLAAGNHTVEVRVTSSGKNMYVSYFAGNGNQPATAKVKVGNMYKLNATGIADFGVTEAISIAFRDAAQAVVAAFDADGFNVETLDTFSAINPATCLMPDGLHWNATGHAAVKTAMEGPVTEHWPTAWGKTLNVTFLGGVVQSYNET